MVRAGLRETEWRRTVAWLAQRRAGGQCPGDHMCSLEGVCQQQAQTAEFANLEVCETSTRASLLPKHFSSVSPWSTESPAGAC